MSRPDDPDSATDSASDSTSRPGSAPLSWIYPVAAVVAALLLATLIWPRGSKKSDRLPNIVVITIDTLRADHLGCYGYFRDTTPSIDALAQESILFENVMTTMATTLPAHVSLWTSLYPVQTGVVTNDVKFNPPPDGGTRFLAQMLADLGYETAGFVSAAPVRQISGIDVGFETFDEPAQGSPERRGGETTDRAVAWLEERGSRDEPFFLWIHYYDPHVPYDPPPAFEIWPATDVEQLRFLTDRLVANPMRGKVREVNNRYDGEVRYTDAQVERFLTAMRGNEVYDDSAIVVTSDHGEGLGQHGHNGHGYIYNEQLRIPLIIKPPARMRRSAPDRKHGLLSMVDVIPTLAALLELPITDADRAQFEGIDGLRKSRQYVFAQRTEHPTDRRWGDEKQYSILSASWKYMYRTAGRPELYDLNADPYESRNLVTDHHDLARDLEERLLSFVAENARADTRLELFDDLPEEAREQLRKLGYLDD